MVLQDLENASPDSFADGSYSDTDNDPYASSPSGRGHASYDASALPKPIPILGPLMGFSEGIIRHRVEQTTKYAEKRIGRSMTVDETHALASHLHKMEQTKSYFSALGVGYGVWRWYSTMTTSRFPLYQPKPENIDPHKFAFVKGPAAFYARHSFRFLIWYFVAGELGKLTGQVIAQPLAARDTASDPRLAQFGTDLKGAMAPGPHNGGETAERVQAERHRSLSKNTEATIGEIPPHAGKPQWAPFGNRRSSPQAPAANPGTDDMSPSAGNEDWSPSPAFDSAFSSASVDSQQRRQQLPRPSNPFETRISHRTDEDDASPTGGLFQDEVQNRPKPGESAWERLRRGGGPPTGVRSPPKREEIRHRDQREDPTFTFTELEDERKRAQAQAQRDFDERTERERRGKDFSDEKKW